MARGPKSFLRCALAATGDTSQSVATISAATQNSALRYMRYKCWERYFKEKAFMEIGDKVPDTAVPNQDGQPISLKDFRGKPVVLFFFPKADTPG